MKSKVLIIGAYGLLGSVLSNILKKNNYKVLKSGRNERSEYRFDATNKSELEKNIYKTSPDFVINLSALTDVDFCEKNKSKAFLINTSIPRYISEISDKINFKFIHISTDQVYCGKGPHVETITKPINIYSKSKLKGEEYVKNCGGVILRTNFVGKSKVEYRISFTDWLFLNAKNNMNNLKLFNDVIFSPLHLNDLSLLINKIMLDFKPGCFNVGSSDSISKADFGKYFLEKLKFNTSLINICSVKEVNLNATRPNDMSMDIQKLIKTFNWNPPTIYQTINKCIEEYSY